LESVLAEEKEEKKEREDRREGKERGEIGDPSSRGVQLSKTILLNSLMAKHERFCELDGCGCLILELHCQIRTQSIIRWLKMKFISLFLK